MKGLITKLNILTITKAFGFWIALRFLVSREQTFLGFLIKHKMIWHIGKKSNMRNECRCADFF